MSDAQNGLMQNLLVTGAGIVLGGAIMAAAGSFQQPEPQAEDKDENDGGHEEWKQEEPENRRQGTPFGKKRVRSRVSLVDAQDVSGALGIPRNPSAGQLKALKRASVTVAGDLPNYGANYKTLLKR
jgi:hypothetical protein